MSGELSEVFNMEMTLFTETAIDSAHYLNGYEGKCAMPHGHTWSLKVWVRGDDSQKDDVGILFDFGKINDIKKMLDHQLINSLIDGNPTAENISLFIYKKLKWQRPELKYKVRLYETAVLKHTYCERSDF